MALISAASAVASAEKVSIDGFHLVAEPTKADAYSICSFKPDVGQDVLGPSVEFVFNGDVQIEHDRGINYSSSDSSLATALYLAAKSD